MGAFTRSLTKHSGQAPSRARELAGLVRDLTEQAQPGIALEEREKQGGETMETYRDRVHARFLVERLRGDAVRAYPARSGIPKSKRQNYR